MERFFSAFKSHVVIETLNQNWRLILRLLRGGAVASWLVDSSPDRAVRVRALAGDIVLCSWARHFTLTAPLSTQVYKWVPRT